MAVVSAIPSTDQRADDAARDTQQAFDAVAATYDRSNAENPLLCAMRQRTRVAIERTVAPGSHLLDLGCGPGTDVIHFVEKGFRVTAIDCSTAMVDQAARRIRAAGVSARARVLHLSIEQVDRLEMSSPVAFDAAYSSFGPLNCVSDLPTAARVIAGRLCKGGHLIASVIGRFCPWELALYAARFDLRRALVRFARRAMPVPLERRTVWTHYYTVRTFSQVFERAGFHLVSCRALGLFTPPPYLFPFAQRHPRLIAGLQRVEDAVGTWPGVRAVGDHFLIVMRRT